MVHKSWLQSPPLPHPEHNTDTHKKDNNMKIKSSLYLFENQNQFMTGYCIRVKIRIVFFFSLSLSLSSSSSSFSACVVTINQCTTQRERERERKVGRGMRYMLLLLWEGRGWNWMIPDPLALHFCCQWPQQAIWPCRRLQTLPSDVFWLWLLPLSLPNHHRGLFDRSARLFNRRALLAQHSPD